MGADDTQAGGVMREPTPAATAPVLHGLDGGRLHGATPLAFPAPEAEMSAPAMIACIPVPAFVCEGDRIVALNAPAAQLVGHELQQSTERSFSRLFAFPHRERIEGAMRLEAGACTRLPTASLRTDAGGTRRVEIRLASIELDRQRVTLVTATPAGVPLLEIISASTFRSVDPTHVQTLTPREHEILDLVTQGATSKTIGERLGISRRTVETHRANLLRKLDLRR